jgi:isoquinoline 1-oxidoreductase beta subunit
LVTVMVNHSEMGQGTFTSLALLVAEELDADWSKMRAEHAPVDPAYNHVKFGIQMVGGSTSTWTEYDRLRKAGATARAMLVAAAANEWKVKPASCKVEKSEVVHADSGKRLTFGKLASAAARQTPPDAVKLVDPKQNGGKSMKQLREHAHDGLVMWGWNPGDGRTKPPLSHEEFARQWQIWIDNGAVAP